jgi:uncharacterized protein with PhoU and TrkA domain
MSHDIEEEVNKLEDDMDELKTNFKKLERKVDRGNLMLNLAQLKEHGYSDHDI